MSSDSVEQDEVERDETEGDEAERTPGEDALREDGVLTDDAAASDADEGDADASDDAETETREDLAAQVELLADENRRLREEYVRARRTTHRRTALGLFAVGALALLGALAFPDSRTVLFALGGTGLFAGVLTYYLTPERFVAAETGERVYAALSATGRELVAELGLRDDRVYAPARPVDESFAGVRLFVPQRPDFAVPEPDRLDSLFVVGDEYERGVSLPPSGGALYREFETAMADDVGSDVDVLVGQLADALVEGFEVAESASADADPENGRATFEVADSVYGPVDGFDHPVASFVAVGLAENLDAPVATQVTADADGGGDHLVACEWNPEDAEK